MDGGYYAIKGFEFQVDHTILKILDATEENEEVYIEKIQDINTENYVIQVKYKETKDFVPSSIKKPVKQLIEEFKKNPDKSYYLYCHFKSLNGYDENIKIDTILGSDNINYSTSDKARFRAKFNIIFAPTFQNQFEEVLSKLQNAGMANNSDEAVIWYSNIENYLRKLVVNNPPGNEHNRKCTRKVIFNLISNNRKIIFNSSLLEYHGRAKYFQFVKKNFASPRKNTHNLFVFGKIDEASTIKIEELITQFLSSYYYRATYDIKPPIIILDDSIVDKVKRHLINEGVIFNDGYESIKFNSEVFYRDPIVNKKTIGDNRATHSLGKISFKVRILSKTSYSNIGEHRKTPICCYMFDSKMEDIFDNVSTLRINKLDTSEILKLIK